MKTIATLLFLLLAQLLALTARAQGPTLVLHKADGKTQEVELYTMPRIQMTADKMVISSAVLNVEYAKTEVVRFTFKNVATGVSAVNSEPAFRIDEDRITFHGVPEADAVRVYNVNGVQLPVSLNSEGTDAMLPLTQLPQGVYLICINGRTIKIVRP